jgi:hypothetical protein
VVAAKEAVMDHSTHHPTAATTWTAAARATLHCLTGCAIGEVLGMVIGTAFTTPPPSCCRSRSRSVSATP